MSINVKKYTKDQMAKMVEEATERQEAAEGFHPSGQGILRKTGRGK